MADTRPSQTDTEHAQETDRVFSSVLCAVDGSRKSYAAVEQAAVFAGPEGRLTLLAVTAVEGSGVYRHAAISPARAKLILNRGARIADHAQVPCTVTLDPAGPPAEIILERAAEHDLLALGAPATSRAGGLLIDSVAVTALASFTTPLLAARPMRGAGTRFAQRIVLASDGLEGSDQLVELVARLAVVHDASVILVHAIGVESRSHPHRIQEQARRLEAVLDGASEIRVEAANAADAILHASENDGVSLIVASSRRLEGLHAIGSISRQVVHGAHCSVLLVPPERLI